MQLDGEDTMRSTAAGVHLRRSRGPVLETFVNELLQLHRVVHHDLLEVLHVDAHAFGLFDLQTAWRRGAAAGHQQVVDDLVVDLQEGAAHEELPLRRAKAHDALEERLGDPEWQSLATRRRYSIELGLEIG